MRTLPGRTWPLLSLTAAIALVLVLSIGHAPARPANAASVVVTTTADGGAGSLREAITTANASPGLDTITFAILGSGVQTIQPLSALPTITDPVVIDGASQPGYADRPLIEIRGDLAGSGVNGLTITAGGSTVRALTVNRFSGHGLAISGAGGNVVEGCFIGTTADGASATGNGLGGLWIDGSPNNRVGGTTPGARNVISSNPSFNVGIGGATAAGNVVQGNFIGTDRLGRTALRAPADWSAGLSVSDAPDTVIGGVTPEARNVISGNRWVGLVLVSTSRTVVQGNVIGTDLNGTASVANLAAGILMDRNTDVLVGGEAPGARNLVSGNLNADRSTPSAPGAGFWIRADSNTRIMGNYR